MMRTVVIGGTSGIGLEVVRHRAERGDEVVLTGRDAERAAKVAATVGGTASGVALDLNDTQVTDAGLQLVSRLPRLQELRLRKTKITDEGFQELLAPLESLRKVEVTGTKVSGKTLRQWKKKPGREYLN